MSIAAGAAQKTVPLRELEGSTIEDRQRVARVENLENIDVRPDFLQRLSPEPAAAHFVERMRDVRQASLLVDALDRLQGLEAGRNPLFQEEPDDLPLRRLDLFAGNDQEG